MPPGCSWPALRRWPTRDARSGGEAPWPNSTPPRRPARRAPGLLLADGAMGTMLYARGGPFDRCFDALNVDRPDLVTAIHGEYIAAGAELIETNTFGANRFKLSLHGLEDRA